MTRRGNERSPRVRRTPGVYERRAAERAGREKDSAVRIDKSCRPAVDAEQMRASRPTSTSIYLYRSPWTGPGIDRMEIDSQVSAAGRGRTLAEPRRFRDTTTELRSIAVFLHNAEYESPNRTRARAAIYENEDRCTVRFAWFSRDSFESSNRSDPTEINDRVFTGNERVRVFAKAISCQKFRYLPGTHYSPLVYTKD